MAAGSVRAVFAAMREGEGGFFNCLLVLLGIHTS
jgi:hypothetical protein